MRVNHPRMSLAKLAKTAKEGAFGTTLDARASCPLKEHIKPKGIFLSFLCLLWFPSYPSVFSASSVVSQFPESNRLESGCSYQLWEPWKIGMETICKLINQGHEETRRKPFLNLRVLGVLRG